MFSPKSSLLQSPANSNVDTGANIDASVVSPNNRETEVSVENLNEIISSQVFSNPSNQNNPVNPDLAHQALDNNLTNSSHNAKTSASENNKYAANRHWQENYINERIVRD